MIEFIKKTEKHISESREILNLIQGMASQTRLLDLMHPSKQQEQSSMGKGLRWWQAK